MNMHEECLKRQNEGYHTPLPELIERIERDSQKIKPSYAVLDIEDAIYYLKELRDHETDIWIEKDYCLKLIHELEPENQNDPLTWDELTEMEGKPVWVEQYDPIDEKKGWKTASWMLLEFINDEYFDVRNSDGEQYCFYKGESWKAYRKEREK